MTSLEQVISEYVDLWNAGGRPDLDAFLARVAPEQQDELADAIEDFMLVAPTPSYSADTRAAIRAEPVVQRVLAQTTPQLQLSIEIPRLRARRTLSVRQLATKLVDAMSLSPGDVDRTEDYLARTERGELDPARFSRRLLDGLGKALEVPASALAQAAAVRPARPSAAPAVAFRRSGGKTERSQAAEELDALAAAARAPAPADLDEVDRLFTGGPNA